MMLIVVQWKDLMIEEVLPAIFVWNDLIPFIFEEKIYLYSTFIFLYIDLLFIWFCELNSVSIDQFLWSTNVVLDLAFWSWWFSWQKLSEHPWQRICDSFFLASNTNCSSRCCCHEWKSWRIWKKWSGEERKKEMCDLNKWICTMGIIQCQ